MRKLMILSLVANLLMGSALAYSIGQLRSEVREDWPMAAPITCKAT